MKRLIAAPLWDPHLRAQTAAGTSCEQAGLLLKRRHSA